MSVISIYQLAQAKLSIECVRADHNLLLIVGHANLLSSLFTRLTDLGDDTQRFDEELTLKTEADGRDTNPKSILAIGKRSTPTEQGHVAV